MTESSYISVIQTLNECIARFFSADEKDLAVLGSILVSLDEILDDSSLPESFIIDCKTFNESLGSAMLDGTTAKVIAEAPTALNELISQLQGGQEEQVNEELTDKQKQFAQESIEIEIEKVNEIEDAMLEYEKSGDESLWDKIRANLHSLKGDFGVLGLTSLVNLVHRIEDVILSEKEEDHRNLSTLVFSFKDLLITTIHEIMKGEFNEVTESQIAMLLTSCNSIRNEKTHGAGFSTVLEVAGEEELIIEFVTESKEHVVAAESALIELENEPQNEELINAAFRSCHTIKGVAGFLNLKPVQELAHTLENIMDKIRMGKMAMDSSVSTQLLDGFDQLGELVAMVEDLLPSGKCEISEKTAVVYAACRALDEKEIRSDNDSEEKGEPVEESVAVAEKKIASPKSVTAVGTGSSIPTVKNAPVLKTSSTPKEQAGVTEKKSGNSGSKIEETVRVSVQRLDRLIDSIGEIVIAQSMLTADPDFVKMKSRSVEQKATQISMVMRQIQEEAMALRMVSLKSTFQKMNRLVRDLSQKMGKPINFKMSGEDTELDKSIIEHIGDPLVHMLRNSVDHGLESPEERQDASKVAVGTVELKAYHKSGNVVIDIIDDGRGLNAETILAKAIENGIADPNHDYSEQEIFHFIFAPGFSTAKEITDVSGRGVGMDVVKRNIMSLRGNLDISSEVGRGTTISVKLPLTMAIIDGMVVSAGGETFILPTLSIISTVNPQIDQIQSVRGKGEMLRLHDELYRFVRLTDILQIDTPRNDVSSGIAILVENISGARIAIWVDTIIKKQQVVIKSMGKLFEHFKWISGGAVLGDGKVNLILDVNELFQLMGK